MRDDVALLLELYSLARAEAKHQEDQRSSVTQYIIAVAGALLAIVALDDELTHQDMPLAGLVFVLGIFGAFASAKYHERFALFMDRSHAYRDELQKLCSDLRLRALRIEAARKTEAAFPRLYQFRADWLWIALNFLVAVIGAAVAVYGWLGDTVVQSLT
jgi:hypothetical protein